MTQSAPTITDLRYRSAQRCLIFAIGDIHGELALLLAAADAIRRYCSRHLKHVVLLGDYVDRGPNSRGVVDYLERRDTRPITCLRGNHEQLMLDALADPSEPTLRRWTELGGDATLASYGADTIGVEALKRIPAAHIAWLKRLPHAAVDAHRIYVHAGLEPNVPLQNQNERTLLWIRDKFLKAKGPEAFPVGKHIVHGHTPSWRGKPEAAMPEFLEHRTNLDTGAYATGLLSIGVFDAARPGGPVDLISIPRSSTLSHYVNLESELRPQVEKMHNFAPPRHLAAEQYADRRRIERHIQFNVE
jgi:serine/threonine protein phosphatase 1